MCRSVAAAYAVRNPRRGCFLSCLGEINHFMFAIIHTAQQENTLKALSHTFVEMGRSTLAAAPASSGHYERGDLKTNK